MNTIKVLFVSCANKDRSPYAERYFQDECSRRGIPAEASSAGLGAARFDAGYQLEPEDVRRADIVFVMEPFMKDNVVRGYGGDARRTFVLGVPEGGEYKELIKRGLRPYLDEEALRSIIRGAVDSGLPQEGRNGLADQ